MHRFYLEPEQWDQPEAVLNPEEARHLAVVLRLRAGDTVAVFDGRGRTGAARIAGVSRRGAGLVLQSRAHQPAAAVAITLFQAIPKAQKMDLIIQKATELGVAAIVPVLTSRAVPRLTGADAGARCARWARIALNAAKQCGSAWLPEIAPPVALADAAGAMRDYDFFVFGSLAEQTPALAAAIRAVKPRQPRRIAALIGPEGDLSPEETDLLKARGVVPVSFGRQILRTETAALYILGVLVYEFQGE